MPSVPIVRQRLLGQLPIVRQRLFGQLPSNNIIAGKKQTPCPVCLLSGKGCSDNCLLSGKGCSDNCQVTILLQAKNKLHAQCAYCPAKVARTIAYCPAKAVR